MANSVDVIVKTLKEGKKPIPFSWTPSEGKLDRNEGGTLSFSVSAKDAARYLDKKVNVLFMIFDMEEMDQMSEEIDKTNPCMA